MPSGPARLPAAWSKLRPEHRLAAYASVALFVTMFLPWYSKSAVGVVRGTPVKVSDSLSAWQAFSFVEAAVLLVAAGVLVLLFFRGEGRAFHLPFGDGPVVLGAGVWVCLLVFYRQFDKPDAGRVSGIETTVGVSWGIFLTLFAGVFLAYAGNRLRAAHLAEPPLPGSVRPTTRPPNVPMQASPAPSAPAAARPRPEADRAPTVVTPRQRAKATPLDDQLSLEDEEATRRAEPDERPTDHAAEAPKRRPLPWEEDGPPEFDPRPKR